MASEINVVTQKIPEKLLILRDRGVGLITRIYNIKKIQADPSLKPDFMVEKHFDQPIKLLEKKFPDCKDAKVLQAIRPLKQEIAKKLSSYYNTLLDVLHYRQCIEKLFNAIDSCDIFLDISVNFDLTRSYLDVVCVYMRLMLLLSRIDDRKAVLGLFNAANFSVHGTSDSNFDELAKMIIEFDTPYKQLEKEFEPHRGVLSRALLSLSAVYPRRNQTADAWIKGETLSIIANSHQLCNPTLSGVGTPSCEFLSLITIEHWIIFGFMVCHNSLTNNDKASNMWTMALRSGWILTLFRDEVIYCHKEIQTFFQGIKGYNKKVREIKELRDHAEQHATTIHKDRREYLRTSLRDMVLICSDEPGLIAPKMLLILMGLSFSKDEIIWMINHGENLPTKNTKQNQKLADDLDEKCLAEMLFYMEQMRRLIRKYDKVVKKYYVQYLSGYDVIEFKESIQDFGFLTEEDKLLLDEGIVKVISDNLNVEQVDDPAHQFDFLGLRMDWARLQAYISSISGNRKAKYDEFKNSNSAQILNTIVFHTNLVDNMESLLADTSDMSLFYFYPNFLEKSFMASLRVMDTRKNHDQMRFSIVYPLLCTHFAQIINEEYCPEEAIQIRQKGLQLINCFLDEMSKEAKNCISLLCNEQAQLAQKLLPASVTKAYMERTTRRRKEKMAAYPGVESYRISRCEVTKMDEICLALSELCVALNFTTTFTVWDYTFCPKDYLGKHLENKITSGVNAIVNHTEENPGHITKPSEMLTYLQSYLEVLQTLDHFMPMNVLEIFKKVLLSQTLAEDSTGEKTVTAKYTNWYGEILFRLISAEEICFSPELRSFVSLGKASFDAEEYTDPKEIRALVELIGPCGTRILNEKLVNQVGEQVQELKKLVQVNKSTLVLVRGSLDQPEEMKKNASQLIDVDSLLQRVTIIGNYLSFRKLLFDAVNEKLEERIPFLHYPVLSLHNFHEEFTLDDQELLNEMFSAIGLHIVQEPMLTQHIKELPQTDVDDDYTVACLLMTFIAVAIPELAQSENSRFNVTIGGHSNNIHCIAPAVNQMFTVLFTLGGKFDVEERIREFFQIVSSALLHLGEFGETYDKRKRNKHRKDLVNLESIYILLEIIVQESDFLTMDIMESCFPYTLVRKSFNSVFKKAAEEKHAAKQIEE